MSERFFTEDSLLDIWAENNGDFEMSARMLSAKVAPLLAALEVATEGLNHIVHGDPTKRHAQEWYTTATNSLAQIEKILGQK